MSLNAAQSLSAALATTLRAMSLDDSELASFAEGAEAFTCVARPEQGPPAKAPLAERILDEALAGLACPAPLAEAIRAFAPTTDWYRILDGAPVDEALREGLMVGRPEPAPDAPARVGLFLIAPGVHYPLHTHAAHEVYYVVSGQIAIRHGTANEPLNITAPGHRITPENRVHSLTTGETPCLIAYVWTGDLTAPGWWWDRDPSGEWHRTRWERGPDGRWAKFGRERITEAVLRAAGEC